jgi:endonuclease/exonuclease/phosphatase family metal-dependent hydrolase
MLQRLLACACVMVSVSSCAWAQSDAPAAADKKEVRPAGIWYGLEKARPKKPGALRLAAYNVENLFDQKDDPANPYDQDEMTKPVRLEAIARAIRELDADVLCLEEVESKECLEWFRDAYLKDLGYAYLASEDNGYNRGIEQSVLSRVPIVAAKTYSGDELVISDMEDRRHELAKRLDAALTPPGSAAPPERFQRSPLRVDLKTKDGYPLTVFVVHFKAGRDFDHQRELEALQTEQFVEAELKRNPDANIAVLGDFNGTPGDLNVKALRMSDDGLVSAYDWRFDKKAPASTYTTHASGRSIDFIVMSPGLAADCVEGSFFVLGTLHAASDWDWRKADEIPPPEGYASDHYPIAIDLVTKPDRPASAFKRAASAEDGGAKGAPAKASGKPLLRSDATPPTAEDLAAHAKPSGSPSKADEALATRLCDVGWEFVLPAPKSKTAAWSRKGGNSTWWPGYWWNAKSSATSRSAPSAGDSFKGDGKPAPGKDEFTKTGAPAAVSWIEWLCSEPGAAK